MRAPIRSGSRSRRTARRLSSPTTSRNTSAIDTKKNKAKPEVPITGAAALYAVAIRPDGGRAYAMSYSTDQIFPIKPGAVHPTAPRFLGRHQAELHGLHAVGHRIPREQHRRQRVGDQPGWFGDRRSDPRRHQSARRGHRLFGGACLRVEQRQLRRCVGDRYEHQCRYGNDSGRRLSPRLSPCSPAIATWPTPASETTPGRCRSSIRPPTRPWEARFGVGIGARTVAIVPNQPPQARFDVTLRGDPHTMTTFDGISTDPDGTVARYDWNYGDGAGPGRRRGARARL